MITIEGNTVIITKSNWTMVGILWWENGQYTQLPYGTGSDIAVKSNLPNGTYIAKEYDAEGIIYDLEDIIINVEE